MGTNELPHTIKRPFFARNKPRVSYTCPRCETSLWNYLSEAGSKDSCPQCQMRHRVPGSDALFEMQCASVEEQESRRERSSRADLTSDHKKFRFGLSSWDWWDYCFALGALAFVGVFLFIFGLPIWALVQIVDVAPEHFMEDLGLSDVSWAGLFFVAGLGLLFLPISVLLSMSPVILLLIVIADNTSKKEDDGIQGSMMAVSLVCMGIGLILLILSGPIWVLEWLL